MNNNWPSVITILELYHSMYTLHISHLSLDLLKERQTAWSVPPITTSSVAIRPIWFYSHSIVNAIESVNLILTLCGPMFDWVHHCRFHVLVLCQTSPPHDLWMLQTSGGQLNTSRGPNLTFRTPSRARSSVSFRRPAREYCPPPNESVTNREKKTAFKLMCLNFTLHQ
jgi:hypothetical protein